MKTAVIGGSGFVGSYFLKLSKSRESTFIVPTHRQLDITDRRKVSKFIKTAKPQFVINFAAISTIDECEKERENTSGKTWMLNVNGVKNLVNACRKTNAFLIQISTDAVFPGTEKYSGPYSEDAKPATNTKTINWYGVSKLHAENEVKKLKNNYAILRISHPFGNAKHPRDLVAKTINDIENKRAIFSDQLFTPTLIDDIWKTIRAIQKKRVTGIFHVGCKNVVSRITFAKYLLKLLNRKEKVVEGSMKKFLKHTAPRTRLGGFHTQQTEKTLEVQFHTWQGALRKGIKNYLGII